MIRKRKRKLGDFSWKKVCAKLSKKNDALYWSYITALRGPDLILSNVEEYMRVSDILKDYMTSLIRGNNAIYGLSWESTSKNPFIIDTEIEIIKNTSNNIFIYLRHYIEHIELALRTLSRFFNDERYSILADCLSPVGEKNEVIRYLKILKFFLKEERRQ